MPGAKRGSVAPRIGLRPAADPAGGNNAVLLSGAMLIAGSVVGTVQSMTADGACEPLRWPADRHVASSSYVLRPPGHPGGHLIGGRRGCVGSSKDEQLGKRCAAPSLGVVAGRRWCGLVPVCVCRKLDAGFTNSRAPRVRACREGSSGEWTWAAPCAINDRNDHYGERQLGLDAGCG